MCQSQVFDSICIQSAFAVTMGLKSSFGRSSIAQYAKGIREAPRGVICNGTLLWSSLLYALGGLAMSEPL